VQEKFSPLQFLLSCFGVASLAGIAQLIRRNEPIDIRKLIGALLYSGIVGVIVSMLLYEYMGDKNYVLLMGVSGLAGLGGSSVIDLLLNIWSGGSIQIVVTPPKDDKGDSGQSPATRNLK
jgi:hypothetical protein